MTKIQAFFVGLAVVLVVLLAATPGLADEPSPATQVQPGNYCLSCHTAADDRPATAMAWTGGIGRKEISPCPAAGRVQEEIYYTERLLLAIDRARAELPGRLDAGKVDSRTEGARQVYSRLLDTPVTSLDALVSESQVLRFSLGKSYRDLNQLDTGLKQQHVLIAGVLVSLFLLVALGWGLHTARSLGGGSLGKFRPGWKAGLFVALVFILFSLPLFREVPAEMETTSPEDQARQTALDTATRAASAADRASARAWMLARVGAVWAETDPEAAEAALSAALEAAREKQMNSAAVWGESEAVQEGTVGSLAAQEKAELAAAQLAAGNSRAWALRLMASDWLPLDQARAEEMLEQALLLARQNRGIYRDLDLRAIGVTWAAIDAEKALDVVNEVQDPALRAWGLWEIAAISHDARLYDQAAAAARQVADPVNRVRLLREVAVRSDQQGKITISAGAPDLFAEALLALENVGGAAQAYALSDLAVAAGDLALVDRIDPAYPDARAAALLRLDQFEQAWSTAAAINDPFDRAHAQAAIAAAAADAGLARQVEDPTLADMALRDVAIAKSDTALVEEISSPYYRVQALTALGQYQAALAEADELGEPYPLRSLGVAWADSDPEASLAIVDKLEREVDKAEVLKAVAAATGDQLLFERALGMALAARVRGDALAPAEASLDLARSFAAADPAKAEAAFNQALDTARRIPTK